MDILKGLISVCFLYAVAWGVYQYGYMTGADTERFSREVANHRLQNCNKIVGGIYEDPTQ